MSPAMKQLDDNLGKCASLKIVALDAGGGGPFQMKMEDHWTGIDNTRKPSAAMLKRQIMIEKSNHLQNVVIGGCFNCLCKPFIPM